MLVWYLLFSDICQSWYIHGSLHMDQLIKFPGIWKYINGLFQEKRNSIADALELRLSCTSPSICFLISVNDWITIWCNLLQSSWQWSLFISGPRVCDWQASLIQSGHVVWTSPDVSPLHRPRSSPHHAGWYNPCTAQVWRYQVRIRYYMGQQAPCRDGLVMNCGIPNTVV